MLVEGCRNIQYIILSTIYNIEISFLYIYHQYRKNFKSLFHSHIVDNNGKDNHTIDVCIKVYTAWIIVLVFIEFRDIRYVSIIFIYNIYKLKRGDQSEKNFISFSGCYYAFVNNNTIGSVYCFSRKRTDHVYQ